MADNVVANCVWNMDCENGMALLPEGSVSLAFVDPPYNIGYDYGEGEYDDNMSPESYEAWCHSWMACLYYKLKPNGSFWLAIGDEWAAELAVLAKKQVGFHMRSWVVWYYTFGVNCSNKFTRSHCHLFHFTKHKTNFVFNKDDIRVPSARAAVYNDKRANPDGRLPDDTWILRPQDCVDGFLPDDDVWSIPRVCGTHKQRVQGAANQMPEQLIGRIVRACTNPGDLVLDPMCGTGTSLAVAKKLGRRYIGCDISSRFTELSAARVASVNVGDPLDGPIT